MPASSSWFLSLLVELELSLKASHDLFMTDHAILPLLRRRGRSSLAKTSPACAKEREQVPSMSVRACSRSPPITRCQWTPWRMERSHSLQSQRREDLASWVS